MEVSKTMNKYLYCLIAVLSIMMTSSDYNSLNAQDMPIQELAFQDGERVVYKVYYNWKFVWIPAGEVIFTSIEKEDHYELTVEGISYESYDSFFKVRDYYISRIAKDNLIPINFRRDILEGNYQRYDSLSFDQVNYDVVEYFGKTKETAKVFDFSLEDKVLDMVSAIYYLRSLPAEVYDENESIDLRIFFDKELFDIHINNLGKESKKIKSIGKVSCIHLQPELISGYVFQEGDVMDVWVSCDKNKIPIQIESPISFGSVKVLLQSIENLKYPSLLTELYK